MSFEEGDEHKAERDEEKLLGVSFTLHALIIYRFISRFGDETFWDSVGKAVLVIIGSFLGNVVFEFDLGFVTHILKQLGWVLNQEGDSHDGAKGRGGGRKTGDQGHIAGSGRETVSAEEGDEHKAERAEGTSSDYENERISSTSNVVLRGRVITKRKQAVPSDQEKFPAIKADLISDRKSAATGSNFFGKYLKSLSPGKED